MPDRIVVLVDMENHVLGIYDDDNHPSKLAVFGSIEEIENLRSAHLLNVFDWWAVNLTRGTTEVVG